MEAIIGDIILMAKKKMREQGAYDHEAYRYFVEETIDYFIEKGKLSEDENIELIKEQAMESWETVEESLEYEEENIEEKI